MDTFMDKLAQRLNAQEMIKANTGAEITELENTRAQLAEYRDCLARMCAASEEMKAANESLRAMLSTDVTEEVKKVTEEAQATLRKVSAFSQEELARISDDSTEEVRRVLESSNATMRSISEENGAKLTQITQDAGAQLSQITQDVAEQIRTASQSSAEELRRANEDAVEALKKAADSSAVGFATTHEAIDELKTSLESRFDSINDATHKECVKVYRNVQAIFEEGTDEQTQSINKTISDGMDPFEGKLTAILSISIISLLVSLGGVAFQVLVYLGIL